MNENITLLTRSQYDDRFTLAVGWLAKCVGVWFRWIWWDEGRRDVVRVVDRVRVTGQQGFVFDDICAQFFEWYIRIYTEESCKRRCRNEMRTASFWVKENGMNVECMTGKSSVSAAEFVSSSKSQERISQNQTTRRIEFFFLFCSFYVTRVFPENIAHLTRQVHWSKTMYNWP